MRRQLSTSGAKYCKGAVQNTAASVVASASEVCV